VPPEVSSDWFRCHADANVGGRGDTAISERANRVTRQAFVVVDVDPITLGGVRDHRRLLRIIPHLFFDGVARRRLRRRLPSFALHLV